LAIEHGHCYNFSCAPDTISNKDIVPGSIMPPGYFFTRIAVLSSFHNFPSPGDILPIITQEVPSTESQGLIFLLEELGAFSENVSDTKQIQRTDY